MQLTKEGREREEQEKEAQKEKAQATVREMQREQRRQ